MVRVLAVSRGLACLIRCCRAKDQKIGEGTYAVVYRGKSWSRVYATRG